MYSSSVPVQQPGTIAFGTSFDQLQGCLQVQGERDAFDRYGGGTFAWVAACAREAGDGDVLLSISKVFGGSAELRLLTIPVDLRDPHVGFLANAVPMSKLRSVCRGPGTFVMRYLNGTTKLAEGTFELVR